MTTDYFALAVDLVRERASKVTQPDYRFDEPIRGHFVAYDANTYDGAEDSSPRARCVGYGSTKALALANYLENLEGLE